MNNTRVHARVPYREKLSCYHYYNAQGEMVKFDQPIDIEVYNISIGGIGIITQVPFPESATIEFTLYLENIPYQVMTKIVWSTSNQVFYRYGLEIIGHNNMFFRHLKQFCEGHGLLDNDNN